MPENEELDKLEMFRHLAQDEEDIFEGLEKNLHEANLFTGKKALEMLGAMLDDDEEAFDLTPFVKEDQPPSLKLTNNQK